MDKKVNIIVGRFQPFTIGHMKCIEYAYKKTGYKTVICMIETTKTDERKPFESNILLPLYKEMFKNNKYIEDIILVKNADIVKISESVPYTICSWCCGTDRVESYTRMTNNYKEEANLPDDFNVIEIKRDDSDVSATKLRQLLKEGKKEEFLKLSPVTLSLSMRYYELLKTEIDG